MTILVGKHIDQIHFDFRPKYPYAAGRDRGENRTCSEHRRNLRNLRHHCRSNWLWSADAVRGDRSICASSRGPGDNAHEFAATDLTSAWLYRLAALVPPSLSRA